MSNKLSEDLQKPHSLGVVFVSIVARLALFVVAYLSCFMGVLMAGFTAGPHGLGHLPNIMVGSSVVFLLSSGVALCLPLAVYRNHLPGWAKWLLAIGVLQFFLFFLFFLF